GQVKSSESSTSTVNYYFLDETPLAGQNYYRLKMVDLDHSYSYSRVKNISLKDGISYIAYPNPSTNLLKFRHGVKINEISIYNLTGVKVMNEIHNLDEGVNITKLAEGVYVLKITLHDGSQHTQKLMIRK